MVDGLQVKPSGYATVVDLDGTYLRGNSLHLYIRLGLRRALRRIWLDDLIIISTLLTLRRLRLITHSTMKRKCLAFIGEDDEILTRFRTEALAIINPDVASFIEKRRAAGDAVLLATAASEIYVPAIWDGDYVATAWGAPELRGEAKRDAVAAWLKEKGLKINHFLTDHSDDLPLAAWAEAHGAKVHWIN